MCDFCRLLIFISFVFVFEFKLVELNDKKCILQNQIFVIAQMNIFHLAEHFSFVYRNECQIRTMHTLFEYLTFYTNCIVRSAAKNVCILN